VVTVRGLSGNFVHRGGVDRARRFRVRPRNGRSSHGDLDALVAQSGDAPRPVSFDGGLTFKLKAKLATERERHR
jgi:hypothetical protein